MDKEFEGSMELHRKHKDDLSRLKTREQRYNKWMEILNAAN